jgi:hypothetical protein
MEIVRFTVGASGEPRAGITDGDSVVDLGVALVAG